MTILSHKNFSGPRREFKRCWMAKYDKCPQFPIHEIIKSLAFKSQIWGSYLLSSFSYLHIQLIFKLCWFYKISKIFSPPSPFFKISVYSLCCITYETGYLAILSLWASYIPLTNIPLNQSEMVLLFTTRNHDPHTKIKKLKRNQV